jgi:hypothetical protein
MTTVIIVSAIVLVLIVFGMYKLSCLEWEKHEERVEARFFEIPPAEPVSEVASEPFSSVTVESSDEPKSV